MKKILFVLNTGLLNSGVPNVIMNIISNLKSDVTFDILVCDTGDFYYDSQFRSFGGSIFKVHLWDYDSHKLIYPLRGIKLFRYVYNILVRNGPYQAIHCHNGRESGICILAAKLAGVKIRITHSHGKYTRGGKNLVLRSYYWLCQALISCYSTVKLACSNEAGITLFGKNCTFVNVLNPVDVSKYNSIIPVNNRNEINILQIGYFCDNKNQIFSIKLLKRLIDMNCKVHLYYLGFENQEGYLRLMQQSIENYKLQNYIDFLPHDYNKCSIFNKVDVLLLPSLSEGLGMVLLEAQSANIKCIVSTNVPNDANLGLCEYVSLNDENLWIEKINSIRKSSLVINKDKLKSVDINDYVDRMKEIYQVI